jgi:hypothetical protein
VAEDSSRIAPIHFVCRPGASFVSSTHALQIIARCDRSEATGEARMFMQRDCARQEQAVSLGILTDTIAATMLAAETAEPFVFVAYRIRAGGQNLLSGDFWRRAPARAPDASFVVRNVTAMHAHQNGNPRTTAAAELTERARMTGVGDGASLSIPLERTPRLPSDHPKKSAARRGKSHRGAQERTRGNCSQLSGIEQGVCQAGKCS